MPNPYDFLSGPVPPVCDKCGARKGVFYVGDGDERVSTFVCFGCETGWTAEAPTARRIATQCSRCAEPLTGVDQIRGYCNACNSKDLRSDFKEGEIAKQWEVNCGQCQSTMSVTVTVTTDSIIDQKCASCGFRRQYTKDELDLYMAAVRAVDNSLRCISCGSDKRTARNTTEGYQAWQCDECGTVMPWGEDDQSVSSLSQYALGADYEAELEEEMRKNVEEELREAPVWKCPACDSGGLQRDARTNRWECYTCSETWTEAEVLAADTSRLTRQAVREAAREGEAALVTLRNVSPKGVVLRKPIFRTLGPGAGVAVPESMLDDARVQALLDKDVLRVERGAEEQQWPKAGRPWETRVPDWSKLPDIEAEKRGITGKKRKTDKGTMTRTQQRFASLSRSMKRRNKDTDKGDDES